jgi:hypothetical protein
VAPRRAAQVSQLPSHAALQQKPSAQCWLAHSASTAQVAPLGALPLHSPEMHERPDAHSAPEPQVVPHAAELPVQRYGRHEGAPGEPGATKVQVPSNVAPSAVEQASQLPSHALSQQTPSTQKPDWQSPFAVHDCPLASACTQLPPLQKKPEAHTCESVQAVGQSVPWPEQT